MSPAAGDLYAAIDAALRALLKLVGHHPAKRVMIEAPIARYSP